MSLMTFLALSILGVDFLLYALFQWTYGERDRKRARRRGSRLRNIAQNGVGRLDLGHGVSRHDLVHHNLVHQAIRPANVQSISRAR
jgi:hypothetical protein